MFKNVQMFKFTFQNIIRQIIASVFTAQCTLVQMRGLGIACSPSVRLSVCDVGGL